MRMNPQLMNQMGQFNGMRQMRPGAMSNGDMQRTMMKNNM